MILALLLAAFALPALANGPCHDSPAAAPAVEMAAAMPHGAHRMPQRDDHATLPHVCIGCIPPASLAARALAAHGLDTVAAFPVVAIAFDPAAGVPPALPPPRRDA